MKRVIFIVMLLAAFPVRSEALNDSGTDSDLFDPFKPSLGFSLSYSPDSFEAWGTMRNTRSVFASIHLNHTRFGGNRMPAIDFGSKVIATGIVRYPIDGQDGIRETVYGIGLKPVHLNIALRNSLNRPFITTSAGFLVTNREFPDYRGAKMNYLLDFGIGWQLPVGDSRYIRFGYKLHHFSNGNQGDENPGVDSHMFFMNLQFRI